MKEQTTCEDLGEKVSELVETFELSEEEAKDVINQCKNSSLFYPFIERVHFLYEIHEPKDEPKPDLVNQKRYFKEHSEWEDKIDPEKRKIQKVLRELKDDSLLSYFIGLEKKLASYECWQKKYGKQAIQEYKEISDKPFPARPGIGPDIDVGHGHFYGYIHVGTIHIQDYGNQELNQKIKALVNKFRNLDDEVTFILKNLYPKESKTANEKHSDLFMSEGRLLYKLIIEKEGWTQDENDYEKVREKAFEWARQNPNKLIEYREEKTNTARQFISTYHNLINDYLNSIEDKK